MRFDGAGVRRRGRAVLAALAVIACALAAAAPAGASSFTVDATGDEPDASPGDEACLTAGGKCSLRAAIQESNALAGEFDEVLFDEAIFDGQGGATIALGGDLPVITDRLAISGHRCQTAAGVEGPCVGLAVPGGGTGLAVASEEVEVEGLAIAGGETGISVTASPFFRLVSSWIGVGLDGSAGGNGTGVLIGPGSNSSRIGRPDGTGNVFANSAGVGLDLQGASRARLLGNLFGVAPDGSTPAPNGTDLEVTGFEGSEAAETEIGGRIGASGQATPGCDRECNLISGASGVGVDLQGEAADGEEPAVSTTVAGNFIGLDAAGTATVPNLAGGIRVGEADRTVVGGSSPGDANRLAGGLAGLTAGPQAEDLVVRGNLIGVDPAGQGSLGAPGEGISVDSNGVAGVALEAIVAGNEIRMDGGIGISQRGFGAWIADNRVLGAETGILTSEPSEHGNLIEGNSIELASGNGVLIENHFNELVGNLVSGSGGAGILIQGATSEANRNVVGGDGPADGNLIAGSGGAAIEVLDREGTVNEVARNRGSDNAGPFIDLVPVSPLTEAPPNFGIEPPTVAAATQAGAGGAAEPGATVRVFRKQSTAAGELDSFLGEAVADSEGAWSLAYDEAVPTGAVVAATQTKEGGTSELAIVTTPGAAAGAGTDAGAAAGGTAVGDRFRPRTAVLRGPGRRLAGGRARFVFAADEPGSSFECRLDGSRFRPCRSPKTYRGLSPGGHRFEVRAVDPAGNVDRTPARRSFTVMGRK